MKEYWVGGVKHPGFSLSRFFFFFMCTTKFKAHDPTAGWSGLARMTKRVTHPRKQVTQRGTMFSRTARFSRHEKLWMVVNINPTAQDKFCAFKVRYYQHIHHRAVRTAQWPATWYQHSLQTQSNIMVPVMHMGHDICAPCVCA